MWRAERRNATLDRESTLQLCHLGDETLSALTPLDTSLISLAMSLSLPTIADLERRRRSTKARMRVRA